MEQKGSVVAESKNFYMVFMGDWYYPNTGWKDHRGTFQKLEEAKDFIKENKEKHNWGHIVDFANQEICFNFERCSFCDGKGVRVILKEKFPRVILKEKFPCEHCNETGMKKFDEVLLTKKFIKEQVLEIVSDKKI